MPALRTVNIQIMNEAVNDNRGIVSEVVYPTVADATLKLLTVGISSYAAGSAFAFVALPVFACCINFFNPRYCHGPLTAETTSGNTNVDYGCCESNIDSPIYGLLNDISCGTLLSCTTSSNNEINSLGCLHFLCNYWVCSFSNQYTMHTSSCCNDMPVDQFPNATINYSPCCTDGAYAAVITGYFASAFTCSFTSTRFALDIARRYNLWATKQSFHNIVAKEFTAEEMHFIKTLHSDVTSNTANYLSSNVFIAQTKDKSFFKKMPVVEMSNDASSSTNVPTINLIS